MKISQTRLRLFSVSLIAALALGAGVASADATKTKGDKAGRGHGMFQRLDVNKDGKVTKAEAKKVADERFAKLDANNDGAITEAEAKEFRESMRAEHQKKRGDKADGKSCEGKHGDKRAHRGAGLFKKSDANNDGKITRAEAAAMEAKRFARLDTNNDGVITQAEAKAAHKARRDGSRNERKGDAKKGQSA